MLEWSKNWWIIEWILWKIEVSIEIVLNPFFSLTQVPSISFDFCLQWITDNLPSYISHFTFCSLLTLLKTHAYWRKWIDITNIIFKRIHILYFIFNELQTTLNWYLKNSHFKRIELKHMLNKPYKLVKCLHL